MRRDLPTPDKILEELADKTAAQIERLAPVAFDGAFRELTNYHRFLLALNASRLPDGGAFSFAEVAGYAWSAPHRDWIRQYQRLFERAADRMPQDDHFIRSLAYAPSRLLSRPGEPELPDNIVRGILDLGPIMMHRLEAWVTKRTILDTPKDQSAKPRLVLAGSDAKAYANVLPELIGAWEGLLRSVPMFDGWREGDERTGADRWVAFRQSWPFLWQHLSNTAYCLAVAVWNEDEAGASLFREALVRWPQELGHRLEDYDELRYRQLLFPDILALDWPEASSRAAPLAYAYMPAPTPDQIFASVMHGAHDDAVVLTATLLLFWTINEKQASDIGSRTARSLLRREGDAEDDHSLNSHDISLRHVLFETLRFEMAGRSARDDTYSAQLDRLVATLDNMTERHVVPGRVFTPSTVHGRDELLSATTAILAASMPNEGDDGVGQLIAELARDDEMLPEGDRSLRSVVHEFERFRSALAQPSEQLRRGVKLLEPQSDIDGVLGRLLEIVGSAEAAIASERNQRLEARPLDLVKLERIRSTIESALLREPPEVSFFEGVHIGRAAQEVAAEWRDIVFNGIGKAQLTAPPMEEPGSRFEEMFVSGSQEMAGRHVWNAFCQRKRTSVQINARTEEAEFWRDIAQFVNQVGPDPVLVVSQAAEGRALRKFKYDPAAEQLPFRIEQRSLSGRRGSYIATVEGVDVFGAQFAPGTAWLFSSRSLLSVQYAKLDNSAGYVDVRFELGENRKGAIRVRVRQAIEWTDTPIFEIKLPDPNDAS